MINLLLIPLLASLVPFPINGANQNDTEAFFEPGNYQTKTPSDRISFELGEEQRSSLEDPDYALGVIKKSFYYADDFDRTPVYSHGFNLRETLLPGDIVYERNQIGAIGHVGIVLDTTAYSPFGYIVRTIEAVGTKVQYCYVDEQRFVEKDMAILRVSNRPSFYEDALYFAEVQINDPYDFPLLTPRVNTSITAEEWYCSELVYAAYLYAGIDLSTGSSWESGTHIMPEDIYDSSYTAQLSILKNYLHLSVLGKSWNTWSIDAYNYSTGVTIYYNTKMCWLSDAKAWNNLNDVSSISASSYSYTTLYISENWWADAIAVSIVDHDVRCISYANSLSNNPAGLTIGYCYQWA